MKRQKSAGVRVVQIDHVEFSASAVSTPAEDTDATVTFAAESGIAHGITGLVWSYDAVPTGGRITISGGTDVYLDMDITVDGAGFLPFTPEHIAPVGSALVVTLAAGGSGVTGKLTVLGHRKG